MPLRWVGAVHRAVGHPVAGAAGRVTACGRGVGVTPGCRHGDDDTPLRGLADAEAGAAGVENILIARAVEATVDRKPAARIGDDGRSGRDRVVAVAEGGVEIVRDLNVGKRDVAEVLEIEVERHREWAGP